MWKDGVELTVLGINVNIINCLVKLDSMSTASLVTFIYGALNDIDKNNQWQYLDDIRHNHRNSWILIGDLNFILNSDEKEGGNTPSQFVPDYYNNLIHTRGLYNMNYIGNPFTWTNRREVEELILERLDRSCASLDWFQSFTNAITYHLTSLGSDHCPIMLVTSKMDNPTKNLSG